MMTENAPSTPATLPSLRDLREARQWSVRKLSEFSGVPCEVIKKVERGRLATKVTARRLTQAFGVGLRDVAWPHDRLL